MFQLDTSTYHYKSRRLGQAPLEHRIREICQTRVRYGYRRVHVLLRRDGWRINQKKTRRIYRELGLQLRNKTPKRRVKAKLRDDRRNATRPNETWAMDFVHDQLATGTKLRVLTIVDTFSRFSPALVPRLTFRGADVVECWKESGERSDCRQAFVSTRAQSLYHAIWICGPTNAASPWTSPDLASPQITPSSKRSIVASELNALTPTGS